MYDESFLKQRLEYLKELNRLKSLTTTLVTKFDELANEMAEMDTTTAQVQQVTDNWNQIVKTVGMAVTSAEDSQRRLPGRLVRVKTRNGRIV